MMVGNSKELLACHWGLFTHRASFYCARIAPFHWDTYVLEFGVLFSGVTTSILALESSPNSLFHFFRNSQFTQYITWGISAFVVTEGMNEVSECCDVISESLIGLRMSYETCQECKALPAFCLRHFSELCLYREVLKDEIMFPSGAKNRLAHSLL